MHNHYFTDDQAHHRPCLRTKRKRIPRVPACYPLTPTLQLTAKMMNNHNLRNSSQPTTTPQLKNRRLQIHPKHRRRLKQLTLLVLAALSPPVNPCRTSTSPQADIPTLQNMEKTACERVASYETRLHNAREHLTRIRKRLKRMQDGHSPGTPQPAPVADIEMEIID